MNVKVKEFLILFGIQLVVYGVMTINYRAVAQANYVHTVLSDIVIATLQFFVIRKIATDTANTGHQLAGYVLGGAVGSVLGIYISKLLLGS